MKTNIQQQCKEIYFDIGSNYDSDVIIRMFKNCFVALVSVAGATAVSLAARKMFFLSHGCYRYNKRTVIE